MLHIISQVPKTLEPRLKNAQTMAEVWTILDDEYLQHLDLVNDFTRDLISFKFTNPKAGSASKFMELYDCYERAKNDLKEASMENELNSLSLLARLVEQFPEDVNVEYGRYRVTIKASKDLESKKFDDFMIAERARQREMLRHEPAQPIKPPAATRKDICGMIAFS